MVRTALAGAVSAIVLALFLVAVVCAVGGMEEMYASSNTLYGWKAAHQGLLVFTFFGLAKVWPFPAIALGGAGVALVLRAAFPGKGIPVRTSKG